MKLALCITVLSALSLPASASAFAVTPAGSMTLPQIELVRGKGAVIDKSCLRVCEKWGEHTCEKWVTKCKGDPGYPTGLTLQQ